MTSKKRNLLKIFLLFFGIVFAANATSSIQADHVETHNQGRKSSLLAQSDINPNSVLPKVLSKHKAQNRYPFIFLGGEGYIVTQSCGIKYSSSKTSSSILPEINKKPISISFGGSGFYFFYYFGIVDYLQQNYDFSSNNFCFLGASGGALPAKMLALDLDLIKYWENVVFKTFKKLGLRQLGALGVFYSETMDKILEIMPEDSYKVTKSGRLKMSVTVVEKWGFRNKLVSEFKSNKHVVDTGYASAQIPGYSHPSIFFRLKTDEGIKYCLDGGITNNQPIVDDKTIIVNPYQWTDLSVWGCLRQTTCLKEIANLIKRGFEDAKAHPEHWKLLEPYRRKEPRGNSLFDHLNKGVLVPQSKL